MFSFACSVVLWEGRGTANKYHWRVWRALAVFQPHGVCPHSRYVCFPYLHCSGSRLLYREPALRCVHFPGTSCSDLSSQVFHKGADLIGPVFCAFPVRAAQGTRSLMSTPSPGAARLLPSLSQLWFLGKLVWCALRLFWGADLWCDPPGGCQLFRISGSLWLETGSLFAVW